MKHSKQRDAILEVLRSQKTHPTADNIYDMVREKMPNISLGTVYRNLNLLSKGGEISKIDAGLDQSHYDGIAKPHNHFICRKCNSIIDVDDEYDYEIDKKACPDIKGDVEYHTLMFYGVCDNCKDENNN